MTFFDCVVWILSTTPCSQHALAPFAQARASIAINDYK